MKRVIALGGLALLLALVVLFDWRQPAPKLARDGIKLTSASIRLPAETEALPAGPHADLVTASCTACHSAAMLTTQPPLSPEQWQASVTKMREVYRAPIADADLPAILAYLNRLSAAKETR